MTQAFPSFELQATAASLLSLGHIKAYKVESVGRRTDAVWLNGEDEQVRLVSVEQRDVLPKFELFTLAITTLEELEARTTAWKPGWIPDDAPEIVRRMMTTPPRKLEPPATFEEWKFGGSQAQVLRRAEFIFEGVKVGPTVGDNPNVQAAAPPNRVPADAAASCEVAVGVLFSSGDKRLLMGVDWMAYDMVVTEDSALIDQYLELCETVELRAYLNHVAESS